MVSKRHRTRGRRAGYTLMEVMVASSVSFVILSSLVGLQYMTAFTGKNYLNQTRARTIRRNTLDQIRFRLFNAKIGTCAVSSEGHRLDYSDPNLAGVASAFDFDRGSLIYDADTGDGAGPVVLVKGARDVRFDLLNAGSIVRVSVSSAANVGKGGVDEEIGETMVYLRNH